MKQIILILVLLLCIPMVYADTQIGNPTESTVTVINETYDNTTIDRPANTTALNQSIRIGQGDCVNPGETLDIAGLGWYTGTITYYGRYYTEYGAGSILDIKDTYPVNAWDLNKFYLDPDFFKSHLGYWYIYDQNTDISSSANSHGNDRIFEVELNCTRTVKENQSLIQSAINRTQEIEAALRNQTALPIKSEFDTDYILSRYAVTSMDEPGVSTRWIFGNTITDKYYDTSVNTVSTFDIHELQPGNYDVLYIKSGSNNIVEEHYNNVTKTIVSPFKDVQDVSLYGIQPKVAETLLINMIQQSKDDNYTIRHIAVQEPKIEIEKLDQSTLSNYEDRPTVFTIAGYTNANPDTTVKIQVDANQTAIGSAALPFQMAYVINNGGEGAYRSWNKTFQVNMNSLGKGYHYITATNSEGATATIPFFIKSEDAQNSVPNVTLNYISNNPFIPTPTPEIITKTDIQIVTTIVTVTVPVTPSQESLDQASTTALINAIVVTIAGIVLVGIVAYIVTVIVRVAKRRKE